MRLLVWVRALRLPFLGASVLPYAAGALLLPAHTRAAPFVLGLLAVAFAHLAANLANDLADTRSGVDARDPVPYGFFGGSKVILEGLLPARSIARGSAFFAGLSLLALGGLVWLEGSPGLLLFGALALALGLAYSLEPLRLSYRGGGEILVGILFGPVTVAAGGAAQGVPLDEPALWLAGVPLGFFTSAILFANEVPDAPDDAAAGKRTLVVRCGRSRGWLLFAAASLLGYLSLGGVVAAGWAGPVALAGTAGLALGASALVRLRAGGTKLELRSASRGAILQQTVVALAMMTQGVWNGI